MSGGDFAKPNSLQPIKPFPRGTPVYFRISPDAGHPKCLCSVCHERILENEFPLRAFAPLSKREARFCDRCQKEYFGIEHFAEVESIDVVEFAEEEL